MRLKELLEGSTGEHAMNDWAEQEAWRDAHREQIGQAMRLSWLFWLGCLGEPVVLAVVVYGFGHRIREAAAPDSSLPLALIRAVFILVAVLALVASVLLRRFMLRRPSGGVAAPKPSSRGGSLQPSWGALYRVRVAVPMVMASAPCIFGFVLFFLGERPAVFLAFALAASLGLLWHRPRADELVAFAMRCEQGLVESAG